MRITTKNLILVSRSNYSTKINNEWIVYSRKKKYSDQLDKEVACIGLFVDKNIKGCVILDINVRDNKSFELFGREGINALIKRYIFRQKDIIYVKYPMDKACDKIKDVLINLEFSQPDVDVDCLMIEKPMQHYKLLFMMVGGFCGMSFGRDSAAPFLMVLVGFAIGFLIGFPLDKKDKEARL